MTAITNTPENKNLLSPFGFKFQIHRAPGVNFFVQSVNIPSVTLGEAQVSTPFSRLPLAGDHIMYGAMQITFTVDEELRNYKEMLDWIKALGFPDNFDQYKQNALVTRNTGTGQQQQGSGKGVYSDATLTVLSSAKNPILNVIFKNIYPVTLTDINFDSSDPDLRYVTATCSFNIQGYDIEYLI